MFRILAIVLLLVSFASAGVFDAPPAAMAPNIFGDPPAGAPLRVLTVEERIGLPRTRELVRVPVFFHEGECDDPQALAVFDGDRQLPYQADDIRRDPAGRVARMHLYFLIDLQPWERKQFQLRKGRNLEQPAMTVTEADDRITLAGEDVSVTFLRNGAIAGIESKLGKVNLPDGSIAPAVRLIRQGNDRTLAILRTSEIGYDQAFSFQVRDLQYGAGPLFTKLRVLISPREHNGDIAEYVYRIPRHGAWFSQTSLFYPDDPNTADVVGTNRQSLLCGRLTLGEGDEIVPIPAGLRLRTRTVFNFTNDAIVNRAAGVSLMMVPGVQMGTRGIRRDEEGVVTFVGCPDFLRRRDSHSGSLRAFMGEARFVFFNTTDPEALWHEHRRYFQPLTAIVDEPAATPAHFADFARTVAEQYRLVKNWSGGPESRAVLAYYRNDKPSADIALRSLRGDVNALLPTQEAIDAAWKKWQGAGLLDPYTITYSRSAMVPMSRWLYPNDAIDEFIANLAQASRLTNGRVTEQGWPHVKSFANAVNMHVGTYLAGVYGGRKTDNRDLVKWCLDATQNQSLHGIYGHGQRPYSINVGDKDPSDQLYMSVTDLWLRAIELVADEDLNLHPMLYGRYMDCVDVNADLYQRLPPGANPGKQGYYRAAMMRGQAHDHRWENFGIDPYLAMFQRAGDGGKVGITEACYWLHRDIGLTMTWNTLMTNVFVPDTLLKHGLRRYQPAPRPPLPTDLAVTDAEGGAKKLTWKAPADAGTIRGYRVYRATRIGGPWTWLNSPYAVMPGFVPPTQRQRQATTRPALGPAYELKIPRIPDTLVRELSYTDPNPPDGAVYFVTSEDVNGRESRWFPDEPAHAAP